MDRPWEHSESTVLSAAGELLEDDRRGVLATLVGVSGSAYRRPGAKMLLPADDSVRGTITPGCLEGELRQLASDVLRTTEPRIETFDLRRDDDEWGLGIACDGVVDVLLEPVDQTLEPAVTSHEAGDPCTVLTVIESDGSELRTGDRAYYTGGDALLATRGEWPEGIRDAVLGPAQGFATERGSETIPLDEESVTIFVDGLAPPPRLLLVGSGRDVRPVAELAVRTGFEVTVVSYRGDRLDHERMGDALTAVSTSPADIATAVDVDADTYAVVMTHNFVDDRLTVDTLLDTAVPYVGIVGSRGRSENLLDAVEREQSLSSDDRERIYSPIGLDVGGETPAQIALSIVSEVLAVHNDRPGGHLRDRTGPIHDRES